MKTLEETKDQYARELGFPDWDSLFFEGWEIGNNAYDEISNRHAIEVANQALINASEKATISNIRGSGYNSVKVDKKSILDKSNIPNL